VYLRDITELGKAGYVLTGSGSMGSTPGGNQ